VSLRDVDRTLQVMMWFYEHDELFDLMDRKAADDANPETDDEKLAAPQVQIKCAVLCHHRLLLCINNDVHLANCFSDGTEEWKLFCDLQCNNRFGSCLGLMSTFKHKDF